MEFDLINSLSERVMSVQNRNVLLANRPHSLDFFAPNSLTEAFQQLNIPTLSTYRIQKHRVGRKIL